MSGEKKILNVLDDVLLASMWKLSTEDCAIELKAGWL